MNDDNVINLKDYQYNSKEVTEQKDSVSSTPPTNLGRRSIAFTVDMTAIMLFFSFTLSTYAIFVNDYMVPLASNNKLVLINGSVGLSAFVFMSIFYTYFLFTNFVLNGKSIGKLAMGLRTIDQGFIQNNEQIDSSINFRKVARRSMGYLFCYLSFGAFFIFNFTSEDKLGIADFLSGTQTVDDKWLKRRLEHKKMCLEEVTIDVFDLPKSA